jgi:hypothetical protein
MALRTPRTDLHPASISRTFTTAGAQIVLADQSEASNVVSPAGAPAAGIDHLPSTVLLLAPAAGGAFVWKDILGNSNTITFPAVTAGNTPTLVALPFTLASIEAGTAAGFIVTCSWHPEA